MNHPARLIPQNHLTKQTAAVRLQRLFGAVSPSRSLLADGVRLTEKFDHCGIDIVRHTQAKVMTVPKSTERFSANEPRMSNRAFQPHSCVEPILPHHCARKANASLHNDSRLLSIHRNRSVLSRGRHVAVEGLTQRSRFAAKMICESIVTTRMPEVARDEAMAAFRAAP